MYRYKNLLDLFFRTRCIERPKNLKPYNLKTSKLTMTKFLQGVPPRTGLRGWSTTYLFLQQIQVGRQQPSWITLAVHSSKGVFIATQLNSTRRRVELCWVELCRYKHPLRPMQKSTGKSQMLEPSHWFLRWIWGSGRWVMSYRGNAPQNFQKSGVNRSLKTKRRNLYIAIYPEVWNKANRDLKTEFRPQNILRVRSAITPKQTQHGWRPPSKKLIWRHLPTVGGPIWMKFCSLAQNDMLITAIWSKLKPKIEFQHGGRLLFRTGNSYILAAD